LKKNLKCNRIKKYEKMMLQQTSVPKGQAKQVQALNDQCQGEVHANRNFMVIVVLSYHQNKQKCTFLSQRRNKKDTRDKNPYIVQSNLC
jgi:hypothetical protein